VLPEQSEARKGGEKMKQWEPEKRETRGHDKVVCFILSVLKEIPWRVLSKEVIHLIIFEIEGTKILKGNFLDKQVKTVT
jgi:hypothetical protein